jgi:hypothetical protein
LDRAIAAAKRVMEDAQRSHEINSTPSLWQREGPALANRFIEDRQLIERSEPKVDDQVAEQAPVPEAPRNGTGHRRRAHPWAL